MAQPSDIEVSRTVEYGLSVTFQLNEQPGKLTPLVGSSDSYSDKAAQIEDRFDDLVAEEITTRHGDTQNTDISLERRWIIKPKSQRVAPLIDLDDFMTTRVDIKSPIAVQTAKAIRRAQGDRYLQGFYGTAITGEAPTTSVPFKASNIMDVDTGETGAAGITLNKLIAMQELMRTRLNDMEDEMPLAFITAKQITNLLKINQLQNRDYNPMLQTALHTGKPGDFMGFRWIPTELGNTKVYPQAASLTVDGSGYRRVPFLLPSGMHKGVWSELYTRIAQRADKEDAWQILARTCVAFTRVNEDKCFQMLCLEE